MNILTHDFTVSGVASRIGRIISVDEWADKVRVPDRHGGQPLSGVRIREILGIESKSWDPDLFASPEAVAGVGRAAIQSAALDPVDVDALIVVTCTPYELNLGQDGFRFARDLGLRDDVVPIQVEAGCGGLSRAMAIAARMTGQHTLVLTYNVVSVHCEKGGRPNPIYVRNTTHPQADLLWASPGIFSDGAAAMVLSRGSQHDPGIAFYTRDQRDFGGEPPFLDPIVRFVGGGVLNPVGFPGNETLMAYAMSGRIIAEYYNRGMVLNHRTLLDLRPNLVEETARFYTHQAGPAMVRSFLELSGLPEDKAPTSAARLGNLVSPCTLQLLDEDLRAGTVGPGDQIVISVVGAGPERGAFTLPVGPIAS